MDARHLTHPTIADRQALEEFVEALSDLAPGIERDVADLRRHVDDREVIASLFRAVHNIKGDATLSKVDLAVSIAHPIETVLARLRNDEIAFSDVLAEAILLAVDRLELAAEALLAGKPLANLSLPVMVAGLEALSTAEASALDEQAAEMIVAVTGFRPSSAASGTWHGRPVARSRGTRPQSEDLRFFRALANQLETRSLLFKGRTTRLLRLANETNLEMDKPVDPLQLEAAVYMHDVGMMFLPESVWLKVDRITPEEKLALHAHPVHAAAHTLVRTGSRVGGWVVVPDTGGFDGVGGARRASDVTGYGVWGLLVGTHEFSSMVGA